MGWLNSTCNATLDDMMISPGSEREIVGNLNFHDLARIIAASTSLIAVLLSFYLIWMHAVHYTKPCEQRHIIRILFMVPIYALASYLQIQFYWHAIYFQVLSDCYEAFAIASFFALLCHYIAPDLHQQKDFFRRMRPIIPWVMPINWFAKCCGGNRAGPWRTPQSGLTWFNIIWIGIYQYCFIRVAMTITAVVTQYFDKYCESSNSPVFAHIWITAIEAVAVTIAMYCVIQFYVQLRKALVEHKPFLKVLAIKLVIFLSFWQSSAISVGTSTLNIVHANAVIAYPDIKVTVPALLLCVEMSLFAVLHLWAFPYAPYKVGAPAVFYPDPDPEKPGPTVENEHMMPHGGPMGLRAIGDALNLWDFVKAFGRGMRWLFCGIKRRKEDVSYKNNGLDMDQFGNGGPSYDGMRPGAKSTDHLPVASEFRRSRFGMPDQQPAQQQFGEESVGLIEHAAPDPSGGSGLYQGDSPERRPARQNQGYGQTSYYNPYDAEEAQAPAAPQESHRPYGEEFETAYDPYVQPRPPVSTASNSPQPDRNPHGQQKVAEALWGPR